MPFNPVDVELEISPDPDEAEREAIAAGVGGFAAAGAWSHRVGWWALLVALILTWVSGLDYARVAPGLLRGRGATI